MKKADEDGVLFPVLYSGMAANLLIKAHQNCQLDAWIDFNGNGEFDTSELVFGNVTLKAGLNSLDLFIPASAKSSIFICARFRSSSSGGLSFYGLAHNGEVEDYVVYITSNTSTTQSPFNAGPVYPAVNPPVAQTGGIVTLVILFVMILGFLIFVFAKRPRWCHKFSLKKEEEATTIEMQPGFYEWFEGLGK